MKIWPAWLVRFLPASYRWTYTLTVNGRAYVPLFVAEKLWERNRLLAKRFVQERKRRKAASREAERKTEAQ